MTTLADYDAMARRASMARFIMGVLFVLALCLFIGGNAFGGAVAQAKVCHVAVGQAAVLGSSVVVQQVYPPTYFSVGAQLQEDALVERVATRVAALLGSASPSPEPAKALESPATAVSQSCGQCHGGPNPKGGLSLADISSLDCESRLGAIRAVLSGAMPKGSALDPETAGQVLNELAGPAPAQPEGE